jgi:hypothetical protein
MSWRIVEETPSKAGHFVDSHKRASTATIALTTWRHACGALAVAKTGDTVSGKCGKCGNS